MKDEILGDNTDTDITLNTLIVQPNTTYQQNVGIRYSKQKSHGTRSWTEALLKPVMDNTISTGHGWNVELATLVTQGTRQHTSENTITTG